MYKKSQRKHAHFSNRGRFDDCHSKFISVIESGKVWGVEKCLRTMPRHKLMRTDADGRTALYYAIFTGNADIVRMLVNYGFNPCQIDWQTGAQALHLAASEGYFGMVKYLVEECAVDVNALDNSGRNALFYALLFLALDDNDDHKVSVSHQSIVRFLISHGARFQQNMLQLGKSTRYMMYSLIGAIHGINDSRNAGARSEMKAMVKFMIDAMNEYNTLFFDDRLKS